MAEEQVSWQTGWWVSGWGVGCSCLEGCQGGGVAPCRVIPWLVVTELVSGVTA